MASSLSQRKTSSTTTFRWKITLIVFYLKLCRHRRQMKRKNCLKVNPWMTKTLKQFWMLKMRM